MAPRRSDRGRRDGSEIIVPILRSGVLAQAFCRRGARAEVAAVFERSFYLRSCGAFLCVGEPAIGNGPLTLVADIGGGLRLSHLGLRAGQPASISSRRIAIGESIRFVLEPCAPWRPPRWPVPQPAIQLTDTCAALARRAALEAPPEGFGRLTLQQDGPDPPLTHGARPRIAGFRSWLRRMLKPDHASAAAPEPLALIGFGPGLTPSGDDFLVGALALLDAIEAGSAHAALARAVAGASPASTSSLSYCFLQAAAAGHVGEHLHRAVSSIIAGNVEGAVAAAGNIGHSSGWDMLAGAATALRVVAAARLKP